MPVNPVEAVAVFIVDMQEANKDIIGRFIENARNFPKRAALLERFAPGFFEMPIDVQHKLAMEFLAEKGAEGEARSKQNASSTIDLTREETANGVEYVYV